MNLLEIMRHRRSVRKYTGEKIDETKLEQILQAALLAPSGRARQPWEFIVIEDDEDKIAISNMHKFAKPAGEASRLIDKLILTYGRVPYRH